MTTDYSSRQQPEDEVPAEPVVVRTGSKARASTGTVRVIVENHHVMSWIFRGIWMGIGFSCTVYAVNWVLSCL